MNKIKFLALSALVSMTVLSSCKKDEEVDPSTPSYSVPQAYSFSNVNKADQTAILTQLTAIDTEVKKGIIGTLSATTLKSMYKGQAAGSLINIENLTSSYAAQALFEVFMDSVSLASNSFANTTPTKGVAGVASYQSPTATSPSKFLLSGRGINYQQLISKLYFGTVLYYQIQQKLSEQSIGNSVDNSTVYADQGTMMEHHWDEAFGLFGVPDSFPTKTTGLKYLGSYCNQVNAGLGSNAIIMNAFIKGRAAISNKDMATKQAQANIIIDEFEKVLAAAAIHEINQLVGVTSTERINSVMSESYAFVLTLKYTPRRKMTTAQADEVLALFKSNFYDMTQSDLDQIKSKIATIYGFTNPSGI